MNTGKLTQSILFTRHGNGLRVKVFQSSDCGNDCLWYCWVWPEQGPPSDCIPHSSNTPILSSDWLILLILSSDWSTPRSQGMSNICHSQATPERMRDEINLYYLQLKENSSIVNSFSLISTCAWDWIKLCQCQVLIWKVQRAICDKEDKVKC